MIATALSFNSIKVQLKREDGKLSVCNNMCFNSIKVQLKHGAKFFVEESLRFQFHKGTIKTRHHRYTLYHFPKFQFHKGTIKTITAQLLVPADMLFQFHKGTIKTGLTIENLMHS